MTDQLRDVLTRVADRAGPVTVDPLLWSRAVRTRRRRQGFTAAAAVLLVITLVGGIVLATGVLRTASPPVDRPDRHDPIEIEGIAGDGGLRVENDLAIGRASVAIVNDTGAFVITADDGVAHRLALPGFDAPLYARTAAASGVDLPEILALSPDGTKLMYAWHAPFVPQPATCSRSVCEEPGKGWVDSGARLLDLTTGALDTYPSGPDGPGVTTQMGRLTWNFRWSPDSRLVAFYEGLTTTLGLGLSEAWGGLVLDTTQKLTWKGLGPQTNPRGVPELRGYADTAAPAVNEADWVAWVGTPVIRGRHQDRGHALMSETDGVLRSQPLPNDVRWGAGRFSPDGQTLLVEPTGLSDRLLAVDPGRPDSARQLRLEGDLPSDQVRTELLGWVSADEALAAVHQATDAGTWEADADLALLTLDLDARTADAAVVGHVDAGDTGSAFSFAPDLLAVDVPTDDAGKPVAEAPEAASGPQSPSAPDRPGLSDLPWLASGAAGLALGAALGVMILRRSRT